MTETQTQPVVDLEDLTKGAFDAFVEEIAAMFDCTMQAVEHKTLRGPLNQLKKVFNTITAVTSVTGEGIQNGDFSLWFDQAALFIFSGIVVMLPEKRIQEHVKAGGIRDAQALTDAIKELGNLMVGSWNRIFRTGLPGIKHLKQGQVFIGQPWNNLKESTGLDADHDCFIQIVTIKINTFNPVHCAAVFPAEFLTAKPIEENPEAKTTESSEQSPQASDESASPEAAGKTEVQSSVSNVSIEGSEAVGTVTTINQTANVQAGPAAAPDNTESPEEQSSPVYQAIQSLVQSASTIPGGPAFTGSPSFNTLDMNSPVESLIDCPPVWVDPDDSIQQAILLMQQHNTGYLLAGKTDRLEGLLSRSDIAAAVSPYTKAVFANYRRPQDDATFQIRVKWFITRPVRAVLPETPIYAAIDTMCKYAIRSLAVIDRQQKIKGLITVFDIFKRMISNNGSTLNGRISQSPPFLTDLGSDKIKTNPE